MIRIHTVIIIGLLITSPLIASDPKSKPIILKIADSVVPEHEQKKIINLCTKELERLVKERKRFSDITFYQCKEKDPSGQQWRCFNLIERMRYLHEKGYRHNSEIRSFVQFNHHPQSPFALTPVAKATDEYSSAAQSEVYILFSNPEKPHITHLLMTGDVSLDHTHDDSVIPETSLTARALVIEKDQVQPSNNQAKSDRIFFAALLAAAMLAHWPNDPQS